MQVSIELLQDDADGHRQISQVLHLVTGYSIFIAVKWTAVYGHAQ